MCSRPKPCATTKRIGEKGIFSGFAFGSFGLRNWRIGSRISLPVKWLNEKSFMPEMNKSAQLRRIIFLILSASLLTLAGCQRNEEDRYAHAGPGEELITKSTKQDDRIDNWMVRGTNGVPHRWIHD